MRTGPSLRLLERLQDGRNEARHPFGDAAASDKGVLPVRDAVDDDHARAIRVRLFRCGAAELDRARGHESRGPTAVRTRDPIDEHAFGEQRFVEPAEPAEREQRYAALMNADTKAYGRAGSSRRFEGRLRRAPPPQTVASHGARRRRRRKRKRWQAQDTSASRISDIGMAAALTARRDAPAHIPIYCRVCLE